MDGTPKIIGFTIDQQCKADKFWNVLNDQNTVLDSNTVSEISRTLSNHDITLMQHYERTHREKFKVLIREFSRRIFTRGLYASVDDSKNKALSSTIDGIYIGTLWMCGHLMITISAGEDTEYTQITFVCENEDPTTLEIRSYHGKFSDLSSLIQKASERFVNLKEAITVMIPGVVNYAGISIGGE